MFAVVVDDDDDSKDASSAKQATVSAQLLIFELYEWPNPNRAWPELDPGLAWLASILYILSPPSTPLQSCLAAQRFAYYLHDGFGCGYVVLCGPKQQQKTHKDRER